MTPIQLVQAVALSTGLPEETIVQHDRNLLVAGLRTKGGRGSSAAKVTYRDAARLLTAGLGAMRVKYSADTVRAHEATALDLSRCNFDRFEMLKEIPGIRKLSLDHSFIDAIAALIEAVDDQSIKCFAPDSGAIWLPIQVIVSYPWTEPEIVFYDDDPQFGGGKVVCRLIYRPSVTGKHIPLISKEDRAEYDAWWKAESEARSKTDFYEPSFDVICIEQKRLVKGHSLEFLGQAFRENGLRPSEKAPKKKRARA